MRTIHIIPIISFLAYVTISASSAKDIEQENKIAKKVLIANVNRVKASWSKWQETDCLQGLDFRIKKGRPHSYSEKHYWHVQFRNRYKKKIHFSCDVVKPTERNAIIRSGKTIRRKSVDANGEIEEMEFLVNSSTGVYVFINKVRFGEKDLIEDYYGCDKVR